MAIGQKMGSLKTLKKSLAKGSAGSAWVKYIPKNGSMNVRFIEEPENWVNYVEHWDSTLRKSFPCNGESGCPGCITGERKSNRYLANAVDVDADRVVPLQMPKDLANRLVVRYERNGTLTDRDFELSRSGEGLDTVYDLDAGPQDRKKIDKYAPLDLIKVLEDAYNDIFSPDDDVDAVVPTPAKAKAKSRAAVAIRDDNPDVDEDGDEAPEAPVKPAAKKAAAKAKAAVPEPVFTPEVDEDDGDEDGDDDEDAYDEETLRALPLGALRAVAREFEIEPKGMDQDDIIDAIMSAGEPVEDDGDDG